MPFSASVGPPAPAPHRRRRRRRRQGNQRRQQQLRAYGPEGLLRLGGEGEWEDLRIMFW